MLSDYLLLWIQGFIRMDMSEFQEKHEVSGICSSPLMDIPAKSPSPNFHNSDTLPH